MSQWENTGWDPERERRDVIESTATSFTATYGDFEVPEEIDPRQMVRHDKQGDMGACQGFDLASCGEYLWNIAIGATQYDDNRQFSTLFAYLETQRIDGLLGVDNGSTIEGGIRIAKEVGFLEEKYLPYKTPYPRNARSVVTSDMREKAGAFKIRSHSVLRSYDDVFRYLASGAGAVSTGTSWNDSFYGRNGVVDSISFGWRDGGHATAWLGYSKRKDSKGRNYIWRLNSHHDSYVEIAPSVVDKLAKHQYTVFVGVSDLQTPEPRKLNLEELKAKLRW